MNRIASKIILSVLCLCSTVLSLYARSRSAEEALSVARSFYQSRKMVRAVSNPDFRLVYTGGEKKRGAAGQDPYYYIYNVGQDAGFIMVSGDDRVDPVIGYGLSGSFDAANMPANMKAWLGEYERQIDYARTLPERSFPEEASVREADPSLPARVEPLIKTKWHQTAPYNDLCPMVGDERTVTGCVATAIARS